MELILKVTMKKRLLFLIFLSSLISCDTNSSRKIEISKSKLISVNSNFSFSPYKSEDSISVHIHEMDCSTCSYELKEFQSKNQISEIADYIFIIKSNDKINVDFMFNEILCFQYPVFMIYNSDLKINLPNGIYTGFSKDSLIEIIPE